MDKNRQATVDDVLLERIKTALQAKLTQREQVKTALAQLDTEIEQQTGALNILEMALSGTIPPVPDTPDTQRIDAAEDKRKRRAEKRITPVPEVVIAENGAG